MARKIYRPSVIGTRTIVVTFFPYCSGEMGGTCFQRNGKGPVKILCFIPDFLEGWEISIFLFRFRMSLSCFTLFPGKRMRGLEKKEEEL